MRPIGERVLVTCTTNKEKRSVHLLKDSGVPDVVTMEYVVKELSKTCTNPDKIKVGDKLIFGEYFRPQAGKNINTDEKVPGEKGKKKQEITVQELIAHYEDIVGVE